MTEKVIIYIIIRYNVLGMVEMFCPLLAKIFYFVQQKQSTPNCQNQSTQKQSTQKQSTGNSRNSLLRITTRNSKNILLRRTYPEQQKQPTPYNLLGIAKIFYSGEPTPYSQVLLGIAGYTPGSTRYKNTTRVVTSAFGEKKARAMSVTEFLS